VFLLLLTACASMTFYYSLSFSSLLVKTPLRSSLVLDRIWNNAREMSLWYSPFRCRSNVSCSTTVREKVSTCCFTSPSRIWKTTKQFEKVEKKCIAQRLFSQQRMFVTITKTNSSSNNGSEEQKSLLLDGRPPKTDGVIVAVNDSTNTSSSILLDPWNPSAEPTNVYITDNCLKRIQALAKKRSSDNPNSIYLRVLVDAGGCSGFQYKFELEDDSMIEEKDDIIITSSGSMARVVVDKESLQFIRGSTIDYVDSMMKSSFEVRDNPNSEKACGCGSSFAIKKFQANPVSH
jgi:iron-sulfur cluster assembly accessory protein